MERDLGLSIPHLSVNGSLTMSHKRHTRQRPKPILACTSSRACFSSCSNTPIIKESLLYNPSPGTWLVKCTESRRHILLGNAPTWARRLSKWDLLVVYIWSSLNFSLLQTSISVLFSCETNCRILHSPDIFKRSKQNEQKTISNAGGQSTQLVGKQKCGRTGQEGQFRYTESYSVLKAQIYKHLF